MRIKIVKVVPCKKSTPEWVSAGWLNLELETIGQKAPTDRDLVSGQKSQPPYLVFSEVAFEALRTHNEKAYNWWKTVYPEDFTPHKTLEFSPDACEVCIDPVPSPMKNNLTWEEVLKRQDIVGGQLETFQNSFIYRGEIIGITMGNGFIRIQLSWMARMSIDLNGLEKPWQPYIGRSWLFRTDTKPTDMGNNRLSFGGVSSRGSSVIFPKGDNNNLDPAKVNGLNI
jgi:hypothetical protein